MKVVNQEKLRIAERLFTEKAPILKANELNKGGFCSREIAELVRDGYLSRVKTGYYEWNGNLNPLSDIETAATVIPFGIICRRSAAHIYGYMDSAPSIISIAIPANRTRIAIPSSLPVELISSAPGIYELGKTILDTGKTVISIYDRERTVCDFFRKRSQLGEDLALKILRQYTKGDQNLQRLIDYAEKMRIKNVILPYIKILT